MKANPNPLAASVSPTLLEQQLHNAALEVLLILHLEQRAISAESVAGALATRVHLRTFIFHHLDARPEPN